MEVSRSRHRCRSASLPFAVSRYVRRFRGPGVPRTCPSCSIRRNKGSVAATERPSLVLREYADATPARTAVRTRTSRFVHLIGFAGRFTAWRVALGPDRLTVAMGATGHVEGLEA